MKKQATEVACFFCFGTMRRDNRVYTRESFNLQGLLADLDLAWVAGVLAKVVAELDHLLPCAFLGDLGRREFHHDVHGFHVVDIAGEVSADAEGVLHPASDRLVDGDGFVHIQAVAEDDGLLRRVDAQLFVFLDDLLQGLVVVAAVDAQAVEQLGVQLGEVLEESLARVGVVEEHTQAAGIHVLPVVHGDVVGLVVAVQGAGLDELVAHGADGGEVVLHGQQHVGGTHEAGLGELFLCLDEAADDQVLMLKRETTARAEVTELYAVADESDALGV